MRWANFIHIYQPPTQKEIWVRRIADDCYRKVFKGLLAIPQAKLTVNINGILCELLEKYGGEDVLKMMKTLLEGGAIEITGSAKYHPFLPFLPEEEIERQIKLNEETLKKYFGSAWKKSGFFPPEMAYSAKVAKVVHDMGYKWIIIDELGFPKDAVRRADTIYEIREAPGLQAYFRERALSFVILSAQVGAALSVEKYLGSRIATDEYAVTAMDGETFGHHRPGLETLLFDLLKDPKIEFLKISDLSAKYKKREIITPQNSTWAATKKDIEKGEPYHRWRGNNNPIQKDQWKLTEMAIAVTHRTHAYAKERNLLDQALHSDQYWWASARPWWSLEMIERGAHELATLIENSSAASAAEKKEAAELYKNILFTGFEWQRLGIVDELSRQEDEEVQQRIDEKEKLFVTRAEYKKMIDTLHEQMKSSSKNEEYYRAGMLKDRIRELTEEMDKAKE